MQQQRAFIIKHDQVRLLSNKIKTAFKHCSQIISAILLFSGQSLASDFTQMYSADALFVAQEQYRNEIHHILHEEVSPYLSFDERLTLSKTKISLPFPTSNFGLFAYPSNLSYGKITVPILSIKFFDDLAFAFAWHKHYNLSNRPIADYLNKLLNHEQPITAPFQAFGILEKAKEVDRYILDESNKIFKTALIFLLLHDLAHWHYQHTAYSIISYHKAQAQEQQADSFALDVMARMGISPYGIVHWFMATNSILHKPSVNHPISLERLKFIAQKLQTNAQNDNDMHYVISGISNLVSHLEQKQ